MYQLSHYVLAVVYAAKEYGLVAQRNTCVSKLSYCFHSCRSHFLRMVEVSVQPDWVVLLQHVAELICNSHRHYNRSSGANSYDFNVRNLSQLADDVFKSFIFYAESVTAGKKYVSNLRCLSDVFDTCIDVFS